MSKSLNSLFTALLLTSAGNVLAASSVDLTVKGLITPSACEPTLSAGVVDLGKISAKDLNADQVTELPYKSVDFAVNCDAATLMAVEAKDNRMGSSFLDDNEYFGLGLGNNAEKLGGMEVRMTNPVADGVSSMGIGSEDGGATWAQEYYFKQNNIISVAIPGNATPIPVEVFTSNLSVRPFIAPTDGLDLSSEVTIDGSITLQVKYL